MSSKKCSGKQDLTSAPEGGEPNGALFYPGEILEGVHRQVGSSKQKGGGWKCKKGTSSERPEEAGEERSSVLGQTRKVFESHKRRPGDFLFNLFSTYSLNSTVCWSMSKHWGYRN